MISPYQNATKGTHVKVFSGSHSGTLDQNCIMEHAALEYLREQGIISTAELLQHKTDTPGCTAPWITYAAQRINDRLNDRDRQRLVPFIPRLLRAHNPANLEKRERVAVRVSCWAAREVLHLVREQDRAVCEAAIEAAEGWLRGEVTIDEVRKAHAAYAYAATDAYAATAAAYAATAAAAHAADSLIDFLDGLLTAHEKACADEGLLGDEDAFEIWAVESCP